MAKKPRSPNANYQPPKALVMSIVSLLIIAGIGTAAYYLITNINIPQASEDEGIEYRETAPVDDIDVETVIIDVETTYDGNLPWQQVNSKQGYQFFPQQIEELTVANNQVSENYDSSYNEIINITLGEYKVPVRNSYIGYYMIPEVKNAKYNLKDFEFVFPVLLKVFEFYRPLNFNEVSYLESDKFHKCINEDAEVAYSIYEDTNMVLSYCNANLTTKQQQAVANEEIKDVFYAMYLRNRNILLEWQFDSRYIANTNEYMEDYVSKMFNSNEDLTIDQSQIQSVDDAREFEQWRRRQFGK